MDRLGELIQEGRQAAEHLWQSPEDKAARLRIAGLLTTIGSEASARGAPQLAPVCESLGPTANAAPTPQAVEILIAGFERLLQLWQAARPGPD